MKLRSLLLSFILLFSAASFASKQWIPVNFTDAGMPIFGYEDVYNARTDAGLTFTNNTANVDNAKWSSMMTACSGIKPMYIPMFTLLNMTQNNNSISPNLVIKAPGIGMYGGFVINSSFSAGKTGTTAPDDNDVVFKNIGQSNVIVQGIYCSGNIYQSGQAKHISAFWKTNSFGANNQTQVRNIQFIGCDFRDIWGDCIRNGEASNPNGIHSIDGMTVAYCNAKNIGNPTKPYVVDANAPDFDFSYFVNLNSTTGTFNGLYNNCINIAGTCFRSLNNNGTTLAANKNMGNWKIIGNTAKNVNCFFTSFGLSFVNSISWEDNTVINPTGEFAFSVTGDNMHSSGNMVYTYQGRIPFEYYGSNSTFHDNFKIFTGDITADSDLISGYSTSRTIKPAKCVVMYTSSLVINGDANNTYTIKGDYDRSLGTSSFCPDNLYGIQMTSGKGFNFVATEIYNATGLGWFGQVNDGVQRVYIGSDCIWKSPYTADNIVEIHNNLNDIGWTIDKPTFDTRGSADPTYTGSGNNKVYNYGLVGVAQAQTITNTNSNVIGMKKIVNNGSHWGYTKSGYLFKTGNNIEQALGSTSN